MQKNRNYLVDIARRYYIEGKSQQAIAKEFEISRPAVSLLLKQCRDEGIVEIRIKDESYFSIALAEKLRNMFSLQQVFVTPSDTDYVTTLSRTGGKAVSVLSSMLKDGIKIGISWGTTLYQMVNQMERTEILDAHIVQLMGGLGASDPSYDGPELARALARVVNGKYYPLYAPVMVKTEELKNMLIEEPSISDTLKKASSLDIALVGLSSDIPERSALVLAGYLSSEDAREIYDQGARGHICGYHYDEEGNILDIPVNKRIVGIGVEEYKKIPVKIGVACGKEKAHAIHAAVKGGLINILITDEVAALQILNSLD